MIGLLKRLNKKQRDAVAAAFLAILLVFGCIAAPRPAPARAADGAAALFLGTDWDTKGRWYGGAAAYADGASMTYGSEGAVLPYHKVTGDGQPVKNVGEINDFSQGEDNGNNVNFVKYPSYVKEITGDIRSVNDTPHGYWNYREDTVNGPPSATALTSADPSRWNTKDVMQITNKDINYTVKIKDGDTGWHKLSAFVGFMAHDNIERQYMRITDLDGKPLASVLSDQRHSRGVYFSFAFRGDVKLNVQILPGTTISYVNGFFFDPLGEGNVPEKSNLRAALAVDNGVESPSEVRLNWDQADDSLTTVYRKPRGAPDSEYALLGTTLNGAVTTYRDRTSAVAKRYTYMIGGAAERPFDSARYYAAPRFEGDTVVDFDTAPYTLTHISFEKASYNLGDDGADAFVGSPVTFKINLRHDDGKDGEGEDIEAGAYAGRQVKFELGGATVFDASQTVVSPNFDPLVGVETTDGQGDASVTFIPVYGGDFTVTASIEVLGGSDPRYGFDACSATVPLTVGFAAYDAAPYLTAVNDAVKAGENMILYGTGLLPGDNQRVAYAPVVLDQTDADGRPLPRAFSAEIPNLKYLDVLQDDGKFSAAVFCRLPDGFAPGIYDFWVSNDKGWSNNIKLNAARPLFISQETAYEGLNVEVVGRNFFPTEFGMPEQSLNNVKVKLVSASGGGEYPCAVRMGVNYAAADSATGEESMWSDSYRLTFTVPAAAPPDVYNVFVSNDGLNYMRMYNGQTLAVAAKKAGDANAALFGGGSGHDPLNLGVAWAQDFNWSRSEVLEPSAVAGTDDTARIQAAIDRLSDKEGAVDSLGAEDGGAVYLKNGTYLCGALFLRAGVALVGESQDGVVLKFQKPSDRNLFIESHSSFTGIARLTVRLNEGSRVPDWYVEISDSNVPGVPEYEQPSSNTLARKIKNEFVKNVTMDFSFDPTLNPNRGIAFLFVGDKNFLLEDCDISGYFAVLHRGFVNKYASVRNSTFNAYKDVMHLMASYAFVENTSLVGNNEKGHGWSARSDCYFNNNYIANVGPHAPEEDNNGEIIMLEVPSAQLAYGKLLAAAPDETGRNTVTLAREAGVALDLATGGERDGNVLTVDYNDICIVITHGAGAGQQRYLSRIPKGNITDEKGRPTKNYEAGYYGNIFYLRDGERDWDITPDQTSRYAVYVPINNPTIVNNVAEHCAKALFLYSQVSDGLVAGNRLKDTDGISVYSVVNSGGAMGTDFHNRIEGNTVEGVSPMTGKGGIGVVAGRWNEGQVYAGMLAGMTVIKNNTVTGTKGPIVSAQAETPVTRGIYLNARGGTEMDYAGDIRFTLIEGNTVDDSEYGLYVDSRTYGTVVDNNVFTRLEVEKDVFNYGGAESLRIFADILFDLRGGAVSGDPYSETQRKKYEYNTWLLNATKAGYAFWGWFDGETPDNTDIPLMSTKGSSVTYYAVWGYKLTLDYNYGAEQETVIAIENAAIDALLTEPERDGYTFGGWYADAACTQRVAAGTAATGETTVYAKWVADGAQTPEESGGLPTWAVVLIASGGAAVVVLGGGTFAALYFIRKKRQA
ncbi:MAG: InlB B-repeat-containing protein [Clostridiales bacterium]|jgi:uncharacterized repeat protein (TIGR02543 family)|nr:InlB B-repeat-containing protein [Clostridiales bacterium]